MEKTIANRKSIKVEKKIIEEVKSSQCFFCQMKKLPNWKNGKHFIKICNLCQKKLEMLNQYSCPWEEILNS